MLRISHLPTDVLLYIGEYLEECCYLDADSDCDCCFSEPYLLAAVVGDYGMIQHYFQKNKNNEKKSTILMGSVATQTWMSLGRKGMCRGGYEWSPVCIGVSPYERVSLSDINIYSCG
jgi:hypothetical protein